MSTELTRRGRLRIKALTLVLLVLPIALYGSVSVSVDPEKLAQLDSEPGICQQLNSDSVLKWVINTSDPRNFHSQLNRAFLAQVVAKLVEHDEAEEALCQDINAGDPALAKAMLQFLVDLNYDQKSALELVEAWARNGPNHSLHALFENTSIQEKTSNPLVDYLLVTDANLVRAVKSASNIVNGNSQVSSSMLVQALVSVAAMEPARAQSLIDGAKAKPSVRSRLDLGEQLPRIYGTNTPLGQYFRRQALPKDTFYAMAWKAAIDKVAADPAYVSELAHRSAGASVLYDQLAQLLEYGLKDRGGDAFLPGLEKASTIPDSRYLYVVSGAKKEAKILQARADGTEFLDSGTDPTAAALSYLCRVSPQWTAFMLWHLTRPAEAVVITMREALPEVAKGNEGTGQILLKDGIDPGSQLERLMEEANAFGKGSSANDFRTRAAAKELDPRDYANLATAFSRLLAENDYAWSALLGAATENSPTGRRAKDTLVYLIKLTLQNDNRTAEAWCRTVLQNDLLLQERFGTFLSSAHYSPDPEAYKRWLVSLDGAFRANQLYGNTDIANFKKWFSEFLDTDPGWYSAELRLEVESTLVPDPLRAMLAKEAEAKSTLLWNFYSCACATPGVTVSTIRPRLVQFANRTNIAKWLLEEIESQNQLAADAIDPIWEELLADNGPVVERIIQSVKDGAALSNPFALAALAFSDVLSNPTCWKQVKADAALVFTEENPDRPEFQAEVIKTVSADAASYTTFVIKTLQNKDVRLAWENSILRAVRYLGRSYVIASIIREDYGLSELWAQAVVRNIQSNPLLVRYIIESLGIRRLGDMKLANAIGFMKTELVQAFVSDRVLIEQLLDDPSHNAGYRQNVSQKAKELLGLQSPQSWD